MNKNSFFNSELFVLSLQKTFICVKTINIDYYFNATYRGSINEGANCLHGTD